MKRPILIITLGFIAGIIWGLYFNIVSFIFLFAIFIVLIIKIIKIKCNNNYTRILKVFIKNNVILIFLTSAFISSLYIMYCNNKYEAVYNNFFDSEVIATVISNKKETEYKNTYKIKLERYKGISFILRVSKSKNIYLNYGDKIIVKGEYTLPEESRNYGGFNYKEYLKTQKVYGIFEADNVEVISDNNLNKVELFANDLKQKIISNINKILPESTRELFLGILIGYDNNISEDIQESFRKSSLTHLLAVSGAHIAYIILGLGFLFRRLKFPKKISLILTVLFLIFFMYITDFSASVVRAVEMGIILLISIIIYRKNDIITSISLSILLILLENPYKILDIGLLLSYFATIGIIFFSKLIKKSNKDEVRIYVKVINYLKELIAITIFANIFVIPIMIYNFNTISLVFVISNLIAGILVGPITIGGFILIIISLINFKFAYVIGVPYNILLQLLIQSTKVTSLIPFSEVLVPTPNIIFIIIYYLILFLFILYKFLNNRYLNRFLVKKILKHIKKLFGFLKKNFKIILIYNIIFITLFFLIPRIIPKDLKIYFIDVGQGDSTLIITPTNKKILIDSGGAETGNFDVGKSTLMPYLLDRKIISLDYICISHFDSDHCKGFIYLLNNIKIKNIILSKQYEKTKNFEEIIGIAQKKNINILKVEAENTIKIDEYVEFKILSPGKNLEDDINNNSLVMKLEYFDFSCLFTGDISKEIERNLLKEYGNYLKSDTLKVAHHGSMTSSDENFIKTVTPKISLIGVGKNNKFGHPNYEVIKALESINSKIYRTDLYGEIILKINRKRKNKSENSY